MNVTEMMRCWTEQMGYPLIKVEKETFMDNEAVLEVSQKWWLSDGSAPDKQQLWTVPLKVNAGGEVSLNTFSTQNHTIKVRLPNAAAFVKLNADQSCPLRVQ